MRIASIVFNGLVATLWLLLGGIVLLTSGVSGGVIGLSIAGILRCVTVYGLINRAPWAYARAMRTNLIGIALMVLVFFTAPEARLYAGILIALEIPAAFFTWQSKSEFGVPI